MTIRIVTDSTADISPETADALGITVVPLTVFFDEETYQDNIDIDNATFYEKLQASKVLPRTSQPAPALFQETYKRLIQEGATGILSIHLSSQLSGTYQSACTAWNSLSEEERTIPFEAIDSKCISAAMFMTLQKLSAMNKEDSTLAELKTYAEDRFSRTHLLAVLDTLEYVKRGGRIGGAKALLGNMLSVKPIITLNKEGAVVPVEQPRTRTKAFARTSQLISESGPLEDIAIAESSEEVGIQLAEALKPVYSGEIPRYKLGAALGTHTGPGTVAITFVTEK
ncbi:DegV domain-containing protein [Dictyobacter alpinus]|uniref:DegV domain-containing protein n=1 Tax=Dictyobacter alpinus TaxID=2014873 RepID=A0A402B3A0_9CHLR|nr:DegV family protein [Dictyobacter alpinus]GCE25808.1 DegV domain-containing protein [Dictyobacter alpinus]